MNCIRVNEETGAEEYVYCPVCFGELILGAILRDGTIIEPEDGKVAVEAFPDNSDPIVLCRDCQFQQIMNKDDVEVYAGPTLPNPYAP